MSGRLAFLCLALLSAAACDRLACGSIRELTPPTRLCVREAPEHCRPTTEVESLLRDSELSIVDAEPTTGQQHAVRLTLLASRAGNDVVFRAKWRAQSTAHGLNDPRKEIAAYAVQKLFLAPEDHVVPPAVGHCFDLTHYRSRVRADEQPAYANLSCVFGTLGYWLEHGLSLQAAHDRRYLDGVTLLDPGLIARSASYRRTLADLNLLLHLTSNGDTHSDQFVITGNREQPRVYCVDHTISFSSERNPTLTAADDWSNLHVPALARHSVDRLRAVELDDLEALLVIEEYERRGGSLVPVGPGRPIDRQHGLRWSGTRLQVGLTEVEIDRVWTRLRALLTAVDRAEIRTFE